MLGSEVRIRGFKPGRWYWVGAKTRAFAFGTQRAPCWNPGSATLLKATQDVSPSLTLQVIQQSLTSVTSVPATAEGAEPIPPWQALLSAGHDCWGHLKGRCKGLWELR